MVQAQLFGDTGTPDRDSWSPAGPVGQRRVIVEQAEQFSRIILELAAVVQGLPDERDGSVADPAPVRAPGPAPGRASEAARGRLWRCLDAAGAYLDGLEHVVLGQEAPDPVLVGAYRALADAVASGRRSLARPA